MESSYEIKWYRCKKVPKELKRADKEGKFQTDLENKCAKMGVSHVSGYEIICQQNEPSRKLPNHYWEALGTKP